MADQNVAATVSSLRVEAVPALVTSAGAEPTELTLSVANRGDVIETVDIAIDGLPVDLVAVDPAELQLFPGELATVTVGFVPTGRPEAGRHTLVVTASGRSDPTTPARTPVSLDIDPVEDVELAAEPPVRTGGRRATFAVAVQNAGNVPITAQITARDDDQTATLGIDRPIVVLPPGATEMCDLDVRARRPWIGGVTERLVTVELRAGDLERTTEVRFRQRPRLPAGLLTLLTLLLVATLWATAMYFGVGAALAGPDPTKALPENFIVTIAADGGSGGLSVGDLDPTTVGGEISGTVTAASNGRPARATVEALLPAPEGGGEPEVVAAAATDEDGAFSLPSLLPRRYLLRITGTGYVEQWWEGAAESAGATLIPVSPTSPTSPVNRLDIVLVGRAATLGGEVIAGDADSPIPVEVTVTSLDPASDEVVATTTTDGSEPWSLAGLPAPATYRITFEAPGFQRVEVTEPVEPGATLAINTVRMPAAEGVIAGTVVDEDDTPLGGVTVEASLGDVVVSTVTPTAGEVGTFSLLDLETPATYLLTLSADGRVSETLAVRLEPGEEPPPLRIELAATTGVISGVARDPSGSPLGGVTVTVRGAGTSLTAETLTDGEPGGFRLTDVPAPGSYAVTLEAPGRQPQTVRVELTAAAPVAEISATLPTAEARIEGVVRDASGIPVPDARVTVSYGEDEIVASTASSPLSQRGRFVVDGLVPGAYTITVTTDDGSRTLLRRVDVDEPLVLDITVGAAA